MNNEEASAAQKREQVAPTTYAIYDLKSGRQVAWLFSNGTLGEEGDPQAIAQLQKLLQREITVREPIPGPAGEQDNSDDDYDPFPEESMCYFGVITIRPGDANYLNAFVRRLPYISYYEARPLYVGDIP